MKFTIITAVFNNMNFVKEALDSVCNQDGVEYEHLIMDGGSTDGTLEFIQSLGFPHLKIESGKDKGIYDALNKGMKKASGDIIGILHSDDLYTSSDVLKKVERLFKDGADVVYADLEYVSRDDINNVFRKWKSGTYSSLDLRLGWVAPHPTFFIKKSVYQEVGEYNYNFKISGDYDFILRVLSNSKYKVSYLPESIIKMRLGGESTKSLKSYLRGSKQDYEIAKKYFIAPAFTVFSKIVRKLPQLFLR